MKHEELTEKIIGAFYTVYNELGAGFLESVYEEAMVIALAEAGVRFHRQHPVPVHFHGKRVGDFRADFVAEDCVVVELKACSMLEKSHEAQVINYLRGTRIEVGLLLNFGPKPQIRRIVLDNERKEVQAIPPSSAAKAGL
ncbi:MAG: GxxExxY protein [Candidatus Koribacter versatilis]|uniref:GxxExxY protein n=1 Tax=Candidatus Korobacter versatilis TaxID=658062 RepID=A0A932EQ48_9BACT|nr:GxxExxY protein [Candidatus Koribacter versatilis]